MHTLCGGEGSGFNLGTPGIAMRDPLSTLLRGAPSVVAPKQKRLINSMYLTHVVGHRPNQVQD